MAPPYQGRKRRCAVRDCSFEETKFFYFPRTIARAEKWRDACANPFLSTIPIEKLCSRVVVCKKHFSWDMYVHPLVEKLNRVAVPNLFLPLENDQDGDSEICTPLVPAELQNLIVPSLNLAGVMGFATNDLETCCNDSNSADGGFGEAMPSPESSVFHPVQLLQVNEENEICLFEPTAPEFLKSESESTPSNYNCEQTKDSETSVLESVRTEMSKPDGPIAPTENHLWDSEINESSVLEGSTNEEAKPESSFIVIDSYYRYTLCRLCFSNHEHMTNIFEEGRLGSFEMCDVIEDLLRCKVSPADVYPKFICADCLTKLIKVKAFKDEFLNKKLAFDEELKKQGKSVGGDNSEIVGVNGIDSSPIEDDVEKSQDSGCMKISEFEQNFEVNASDKELDGKYSTYKDSKEISSRNYTGDGMDSCHECFSDSEDAITDFDETAADELSETETRKNIDPNMLEIVLQEEFKCSECGEVFQYKNHLTKHRREHQKTWPIPCQYCHRRFKSLIDLNDHIVMHSNYKPYECEHCGLRCRLKTTLCRHKMTHSGDRPFLCSTCGLGFRERTELRNHMRIHSGVKCYKCEECGAEFGTIHRLIRHNTKHSEERHNVCGECGKSFRKRISLMWHVTCVHQSEKRFQCEICFKRFSIRKYLYDHMKIHRKQAMAQ